MNMPDMTGLISLSTTELLKSHSAILDELRRRKAIRTKNNPTGDYAEKLVKEKLGLMELEKNSTKGYDTKDGAGIKYQIKARRQTPENKSTQLGVIRGLDSHEFDYLIGIIFDVEWQVIRAAKIPFMAIQNCAKPRGHVNGHILHLRHSIFKIPSVEDITEMFRS